MYVYMITCKCSNKFISIKTKRFFKEKGFFRKKSIKKHMTEKLELNKGVASKCGNKDLLIAEVIPRDSEEVHIADYKLLLKSTYESYSKLMVT